MRASVLTLGTGENLTFVTAEVDVLELLEAIGVCKDESSEAQAPQGSPPGCRVHSVGLPHPGPPPLPLLGLTFLTGGLVGGIGAVGSVVTLQEAVNATAVAAAELGGVTGARAHWVGQDGSKGEVRLKHRSPGTKSPSSTWPPLPQHGIMTCPLLHDRHPHLPQALPAHKLGRS